MPRKKKDVGEGGTREAIDRCVSRVCTSKEAPYFRSFLENAVIKRSIPLELLEEIPVPATEAGKTRVDQIYDASMHLAFPPYRRETLSGLTRDVRPNMKIWRVLLPDSFRVAHVLIRADSFQEAFALGADYACRVSLRLFGQIPVDLTVRVMFMSEKAIRRHLELRWANRVKKRKQMQLEAREFTPRQIAGARLAAIGHPPSDPSRSIAKYVDMRDLRSLGAVDVARTTEVESEVLSEDLRKPRL